MTHVQASAAVSSEMRPTADMERALRQQDARFASLEHDAQEASGSADGAPDLAVLHNAMHTAYKCALKPVTFTGGSFCSNLVHYWLKVCSLRCTFRNAPGILRPACMCIAADLSQSSKDFVPWRTWGGWERNVAMLLSRKGPEHRPGLCRMLARETAALAEARQAASGAAQSAQSADDSFMAAQEALQRLTEERFAAEQRFGAATAHVIECTAVLATAEEAAEAAGKVLKVKIRTTYTWPLQSLVGSGCSERQLSSRGMQVIPLRAVAFLAGI